ncbi:hypothetical protein Gasu2_57340 [Galdieria sulphuraria]|uniref:FAS1 domain-containing protein n=1 Tax=Galdieria sulphuraria TaxID=130081 RepID=M2Y2U9_GALSU|nr:uncharacterized protein Gasu_25210 [Galdieria sulphuraria]EME30144.1 hypothetical protein Gasu_25210 [Galdieria sulphuraria]GJD11603.1 hypothetical protein Gasu2_57340 [Galdieria sulphuraria]|eukprot:XP_005706664.1 hypothetical protein Gasu_25210 [Galdieria sulphuraria]
MKAICQVRSLCLLYCFLFCIAFVNGATTIESVLKAKGDFSDIIDGASEAGILSLYNNPSATETVFTPNNTGLMNTLSDLNIGAIQALQLLQNHTLLKQLLLYGTVNESISVASLSSGTHHFPSMLGPNLTLVKNSTGAFVNDIPVIEEDVAAGSSEIQVIETLLIPPNVHIS